MIGSPSCENALSGLIRVSQLGDRELYVDCFGCLAHHIVFDCLASLGDPEAGTLGDRAILPSCGD